MWSYQSFSGLNPKISPIKLLGTTLELFMALCAGSLHILLIIL